MGNKHILTLKLHKCSKPKGLILTVSRDFWKTYAAKIEVIVSPEDTIIIVGI